MALDKHVSSANRVITHDVYLSFCGDDIDGIATDLRDALLQAKISVGSRETILRTNKNKIEQSEIAVFIFSSDFRISHRNLDELLDIIECKKLYGITIMLVFYETDPSEVLNQLQTAKSDYEDRVREWQSDTGWSWNDLLETLTSLPEWQSPRLWSDDDDELDSMVRDIKKCVRDTTEYDVFLSFNSEDSGNRFISHLYAALKRKGIMTSGYNDFKRENEISPEAVNAIKSSKLYLIIFSEDYISSSWCSDELNLVAKYSDELKRFVVPVFYNVDPQSVQSQLKDHQFQGCLIGNQDIHASDSRPESKLIDGIVGDIIRLLERKTSIDTNNLVGISERVNSVMALLDNKSPEVRIVGIEGMAGIGKSTLAKALFDQLSIRFEGSCFLANIRESWQRGRKRYLQHKLVSELSKGLDLKRKKVLIILDDLSGAEQWKLLIGDRDQYGTGTRIILTSRDSEYLEKADIVYRMIGLSVPEARILFELNAFRTNHYSAEFVRLSSAIVDSFSKHNPLALKVLGSVLYGKDSKTWEEVVSRLQKKSNNDIQMVLRICYDQLDEDQKSVFLDIACFFKGEDEELTKRILNGWMTPGAVEDLVAMSLITIQDSKVWMSDFAEDMAKKIVCQESMPEWRIRLWEPEDICHVLQSELFGNAETLLLDMSQIKNVEVERDAIDGLHSLRMLKLHSHFANCTLQFPDNDYIFLPDELRYLYWDACPFKSLHFGSSSTIYLVEIRLQFSKVEKLWEEHQRLTDLKVIDLSFSKQLVEMPNLSAAPNIEIVSLRGCVSLREVPSYFNSLEKLISMDLEDCSSLEEVKALPRNIINVNLARCNSLHTLPSNIYDLNSLICLELTGCSGLDKTCLSKYCPSQTEGQLLRIKRRKK